jgi:hypothetical protein
VSKERALEIDFIAAIALFTHPHINQRADSPNKAASLFSY